ncbi:MULTISPECIES: hypothetical protein [Kaistia]|uniref:Uncharacterized protein n=1 Tax=Kaistia nematophila TaxID=2994654 RepID=A0A9X3E5F7_9HYPH|nr:hypothetical protein [Kaistia nematophila]MBN9026438.1 hypothetical protein [Hyphomicrobiales bacterium]MCX5571722.1 hypothetical protein [Kaistia nematophila]
MATEEEAGAGPDGIEAAIRHFPTQADDIKALARESELFRDICDELAEAEVALWTVDRLDVALRAERRLEWLGFVRWALKEIDSELRHARIASFSRTNRSDC